MRQLGLRLLCSIYGYSLRFFRKLCPHISQPYLQWQRVAKGKIKLHFPDRTAFVFLAHAFSSRGCNCYVQISYCDMKTIVGVLLSAIPTVYHLFSAHLKCDLCTQMYLHACGVTFVPCDVTLPFVHGNIHFAQRLTPNSGHQIKNLLPYR